MVLSGGVVRGGKTPALTEEAWHFIARMNTHAQPGSWWENGFEQSR